MLADSMGYVLAPREVDMLTGQEGTLESKQEAVDGSDGNENTVQEEYIMRDLTHYS